MARCVAPLVECFSEVVDPRDARWVFHGLSDILSLAVLAVIAGAEGWEDIEEFGKQKQAWLRKFLRFPNGVPSHDTISRVFRRINPRAFQEGFTRWIESLHEELGLKLVALDGKTLRRSFDRDRRGASMKSALHAVSAWGVENHVLLAQQACEEKSNEITAIPELLKLLELNGAIVTIDAMGCQKEIAQQIVEGGGDYVLAVKGNQEKLHTAIAKHFDQLHESDFENSDCRRRRTEEKGHGRLEQRYYYQSPLGRIVRAVCERLERPHHDRPGGLDHGARRQGMFGGAVLHQQPAAGREAVRPRGARPRGDRELAPLPGSTSRSTRTRAASARTTAPTTSPC